jgi:hypothetical protein
MRAGSAGARVVMWNPAGWWVGEKNLNWAALIQSRILDSAQDLPKTVQTNFEVNCKR